MSEQENIQKVKSERDSLLKAAEQRYQGLKDKFEDVRLKYNDLVKENNELRQQFQEKQKEFEALKKTSKESSTKLLLQVADIQKDKTKLTKSLEAKEKELEKLQTENTENETFMEAVRQEIIDFRDAKNAQVEQLQQELNLLKSGKSGTDQDDISNGDVPTIVISDQPNGKLEQLETENRDLQMQILELKEQLKAQFRDSEQMQNSTVEDSRTFVELRNQLEAVARKLSEVEDQRQQLKSWKMEMEEKLNDEEGGGGGLTVDGKHEETRARKTSLAVLIEGNFPSRERKKSAERGNVGTE